MTSSFARPLIGLTCYGDACDEWCDHAPGMYRDILNRHYTKAVLDAGGIPVMIPTLPDRSFIKSLVEKLDGLILVGGLDVHPRFYGEELTPHCGELNIHRDELELELVKAAGDKKLPLLGICRGMQMMNVAMGGSCFQDIGAQVESAIEHRQNAASYVTTHVVSIKPDSLLHDVLKSESIWVNSHHHQAVKISAPGFYCSAQSGDGVVEAIEKTDADFWLGVQWHPEGTVGHDEHSIKLFKALVDAAR